MALSQPKPKRVVGLDLSTEGIGFSLFVNGKLKKYGKVNMTGGVAKRNYEAARFGTALGKELRPDLIAYESAVYIQNKATVITLAEFYGAVVSCMSGPNTAVRKFIPIEWQNFIGNKVLTKAEKASLNRADKSLSWNKDFQRAYRKQRTMDWVNDKFNLSVDDDDVSDAIAIGYTAVNKPVL